MRARSLRLSIRLAICAALPAFAQAACLPEEFPGQFVGETLIDLGAAEAKLVLLHQSTQDLKIFVEGGESGWLNGPGGRNGVDVVFLEEAAAPGARRLCFYSVLNHVAAGEYAVEAVPVPAPDAATSATLRLFNEAERAFQRNTGEGIEFAATAYASLVEAGADAWFAHPDLAFFPRFHSALALIAAGRYAQADAELAALDAEPFRSHPNHYQVLYNAGRIKLRLGRSDEAIALLDRAWRELEAQQPAGLRHEQATIANMLGEAYVTIGNYVEGSRWLEATRVAADGDFEQLAWAFNNLGFLRIRQSTVPDITRAERLALLNQSTDDHLKAAYFAAQTGARNFQQVVENNLAVHYARIGERRKSLIHFYNVLRMLEEAPNPEAESFLYSNLSIYSRILGDHQSAIAYLEKSIALANAPGGRAGADLTCRYGTLLRDVGDLAGARSAHEACRQEAEASDNPVSRFDAALQLGIDALAAGTPAEAEAFFRQGLPLLEAVPGRDRESLNFTQQLWLQLAQALFLQDRLPEARAAIGTALAARLDARHVNDRVQALGLALRINDRLGDLDAALRLGAAAMELIETLHADLEAERLGPAWSHQTHEVYSTLAGIHLREYLESKDEAQLELALLTSERARDISLRQRLASQLPNDTASLETQKQMALYSSVASLLADTNYDADVPQPASLDYYHQHDLLSLARLNGLESLPVPAPPRLAEIQARLAPRELVLYYQMTDDALYAFAIGAATTTVKRVPLAGELTALLEGADELLHSPEAFDPAQLQALAEYLLPDLSAQGEVSELLVVADGALHALPFAALPIPGVAGYTPLIERYSLVNLPSLSAYFMDKPPHTASYETEVAIIADPVFEHLELAALDSGVALADTIRGWSDTLEALPYTAREASNIEARITGRTVAFTGRRATRANLGSSEARNARILHIATHGYFKSTSEDNIGLALSTIDEEGRRDPGFITLTELFGQAFNNELVVISGCDTAMGREQAGVGLNSLARGFLAQGVKHVIATLWPVSDRASAEFMSHFYRHLQEGKDVTLALQQAQQDLSRNPDYRNPYYWAAYVLTTTSPDATIALPD